MNLILRAVQCAPSAAAQQEEVQGQRGGGRSCCSPGSCCCRCSCRLCCPGETTLLVLLLCLYSFRTSQLGLSICISGPLRFKKYVLCLVQIYEVEDGGAVKMLCSNIILGSDRPIRLHGGLVLGVTFDKKIRSGKASHVSFSGRRPSQFWPGRILVHSILVPPGTYGLLANCLLNLSRMCLVCWGACLAKRWS